MSPTDTPRPRVLSGIQPDFSLHLGNYLGALRNWARDQDRFENYFCIVDLHALTQHPDPERLRALTLELAAMYMACGLDPKRCEIFVQSHVPAHSQLCWILETLTPMGWLDRMTQFKARSQAQGRERINTGVFTYPVLQAADILLYRGDLVPVGEDQVPHVEIAREIARRFNAQYGPVFPEPEPKLTHFPRLPGLDGLDRKMSKSAGNTILLSDPPATILARMKTAVTDPQKVRRNDPGRPEICLVERYHRKFNAAEVAEIDAGCRSGALGCVECKTRIAAAVADHLAPFREKRERLAARPAEVGAILASGEDRARARARSTMEQVRAVMHMG